MSDIAAVQLPHAAPRPAGLLKGAAVFWFVMTALGQTAFLIYILGFYGPTLVSGDYTGWDRNAMLVHGYIAGDGIGNMLFAAHIAFAALLTFGGIAQLTPMLRKAAPALHRWIGRAYVLAALLAAVGGTVLTWYRPVESVINNLAITGNAIAIVVCGCFAWRMAVRRDFTAHQAWATRLFLVVSGVWFLRVGLMVWMIATQGRFGAAAFFDTWAFGSYLVPLAVCELYRMAQRAKTAAPKTAMAGVLIACGLCIALGSAAAAGLLWLPLLRT